MSADHALADKLLESGALLPAVLGYLEENHERSQQTRPGHSSALGCMRQAGYGVQGAPTDPEWEPSLKVAAWIGTAVHRAFLPVLRTLLAPARIELEVPWTPMWRHDGPGVEFHDTLPLFVGHADLYRRRSRLVLDLKVVSRHQMDYVRREGCRFKDLAQVHANAAGLRQQGRPCDTVGLLYVCSETSLDRQDAEGVLYLQPVDDDLIGRIVDWWAQVCATPAAELPRDERGPGLSFVCDECRWLRSCWGPQARPGVVGGQAVDPTDSDAVVDALELLAGATADRQQHDRASNAAQRDIDFASALLDGIPEGVYRNSRGRQIELVMSSGQNRVDNEQVRHILADLNVGVPMKRTASKPKAKEVRP